jgi:hypothetical protein
MAPVLPVNLRDFGTSRWQVMIERYTNFRAFETGRQCPLVAHLRSFRGQLAGPLVEVQRPLGVGAPAAISRQKPDRTLPSQEPSWRVIF